MNWVMTSMLLIIWSSIMYLSMSNIDKSYVPMEMKNVSIFFSPMIPLFIYNKIYWMQTVIEFKYLLMLFFTAVFMGWLSSMCSLISMKTAPNPGYPLMLSKSYVVYTLIFSYIFLWSELSIQKLMMVLFVMLFSFLIIYNKNKTKKVKDSKWLLYTLYSFLWWWNMAMILTYLMQQWVHSTTINFYLHLFVTAFMILEMIFKKVKYKPKDNYQIINLIIIWIAYLLFQQSLVYWYSVAPNPWYMNAVNTASIWMMTILSWMMFKDDLSKSNLIWVIWMMISLMFLFVS